MAEPHPKNVAGPFYVEKGCCLACGVPFDIAPEMFEWAEDETHCFVKRQPCDSRELDRMLHAMWSSEVECIRYRGSDPAVARRIAEFGQKESCDVPVGSARLLVRDEVRFCSFLRDDTPLAIADRFRAWLAAQENSLGPRYRIRKPYRWNRHTVTFSWEILVSRFPRFNRVRFFGNHQREWLSASLRSGRFIAGHGLALTVHEWLEKTERASEIRWSSPEERQQGGPGFHMPI